MKTVKRTISMVSAVALSAFLLVPGCVGQESGDDTEAGDQVWSEAKEGQGIALKGTVVVSVTMYEDYISDHGSHDGSDHSSGHRSHRTEVEYHLQRSPEDNEPLRLYFDGAPPSFETGDEISVAGTWQTKNDIHAIAVDDMRSIRKPSGVAQDGEIGQSSQEIVTVRAPTAHKIAVLLVGDTTITAAQAQAQMNAYSPGSAAAFIGENSGLVDTFQGTVFSYPSISTANCTPATVPSIKTAALNAFQAAGNSLSNYTNVAYVIGGGGNCGFIANGTVNPPGSTSLGISTYNDNFQNCTMAAHELGHNLGFYHAHSTACGTTKLYNASRSGCTDTDYGNTFDMMGYGGGTCSGRHYSIMQKRYAGYLSKCEDVTAGGSAVFNLSAAEGSCGVRSLRIPIAGESNYYYLELRKPGSGEFAGAAGASRVLLNASNDPAVGAPDAYLLDATPATSSISDAWLAVGTTYSLPGNVSIKVLSIGGIATIQVTMPAGAGAKCQDNTTPPSSGGNVGGLCGAIAAKTYQAEDMPWTKTSTLATSPTGYYGTGFMDFGGAGSIVELNKIDAPRYGSYKLTFRYANGTTSARTSNLSVNDQVVGTLPFGGTGDWATWGTNAITVTLKKGLNKIRVTSIGDGPNLDQVVVASP